MSTARGMTLWVTAASLLVLSVHVWQAPAPAGRPSPRSCARAVGVQDAVQARPRLMCLGDLQASGCPSARAGDLLIFEDGRCRRVEAGMPASWWLLRGMRMPLNQLDAASLQLLDGIGETLAGRIVAYREAHGRFSRLQELQAVRGIGPATVAALRPYLQVREPAQP